MRRAVLVFAFAVFCSAPAGANELTHLINKLKENAAAIPPGEDDILREEQTKTAPAPENENAEENRNRARPPRLAKPSPAPGFRAAPDAQEPGGFGAPDTVALILPTDGGGVLGRTARAFYEGCAADGRENEARFLLYATSGGADSAIASYIAAAESGADLIVGPVLRGNVAALLARVPQAPAPTLLLQPGVGGNYFFLTLEAGREAAELAELMRAADVGDVLVATQESELGARQLRAFGERWRNLSGRAAGVFRVRNPEKDWQRLFEKLKEEAEEEANKEKEEEKKEEKRTAVFAAGGAAFARKVRHFAPARNPVFAGSFSYGGGEGASAAFSDNLYVMETPHLLAPPEENASAEEESRPALARRFFALGADACAVALRAAAWKEGWEFSGLSGDLQLIGGEFRRRGVLARYQGGRLQPLPAAVSFAP